MLAMTEIFVISLNLILMINVTTYSLLPRQLAVLLFLFLQEPIFSEQIPTDEFIYP